MPIGTRSQLLHHFFMSCATGQRQPTAAIIAAVLCVAVAGCASSISNAQSPTATRTLIPRPLVERELTGLLLSPEQVNAAMGTTGMAVTGQQAAMSDNSATMAPPEFWRYRRPLEIRQRLPAGLSPAKVRTPSPGEVK